MDIGITPTAASVVAGLAPAIKRIVGQFLRQDVPEYVQTHDPVQISGLDGEYWVVRPKAGADQPTFIVARQPPTESAPEQLVVVSAVVPGQPSSTPSPSDPADIALGVEVLGRARVPN